MKQFAAHCMNIIILVAWLLTFFGCSSGNGATSNKGLRIPACVWNSNCTPIQSLDYELKKRGNKVCTK